MSMTPEEIANAAKSPATVTTDGQSVTARTAEDLIKLNEYAKELEAQQRGNRGGARRIRFGRGILPGQT